MIGILSILVRSALHPERVNADDEAKKQLQQTPAHIWQQLRGELTAHRIVPLVGYGLAAAGILDVVPEEFGRWACKAHKRTQLTNTLMLGTLDLALEALRAAGVDPVVMKGAELADGFYPDLGMRWMGDVDLLVRPDEWDAAIAALRGIGMTLESTREQSAALYTAAGVTFDLHRVFEIFDYEQDPAITQVRRPRHMRASAVQRFEPSAMLAHLSYHAQDHRRRSGYVLSWLIDLAVVLESPNYALDWSRVKELMPGVESLVLLLRAAEFAHSCLGCKMPEALLAEARAMEPLRLEEILRSRRLSGYRLPALRAWGRLMATWLGVREDGAPTRPRLSDIWCSPGDARREQRALRWGLSRQG